jgi:transglutaminase-like putative cysteine protease
LSRYRVTHSTSYVYEQPVSSSYGLLHVLPRTLPSQRCESSELVIDPRPEDVADRFDAFGNRSAWFALHAPHRSLRITATSVVRITPVPAVLGGDGPPWEDVRDDLARLAGDDHLEAVQQRLPSPRIDDSPGLHEYALPSFPARRPIVEGLVDLIHRIHTDFAYEPGATTVRTTVDQVLASRRGVCQDFAHLAIGCLRSLGLPARYVSGYLETRPAPGKPRLVGADQSHAWLSAYVPTVGWVDADPTNDRLVTDRYITTAFGRDYGDVPPVRGIIYTRGPTRELKVSVDVERLPRDPVF